MPSQPRAHSDSTNRVGRIRRVPRPDAAAAGTERRVLPIICLNEHRKKENIDPDNPYNLPTCECGVWVHHGTDYKRRRMKYRCPTGRHGSTWLKPSRMHTLVPRDSRKWKKLYSGRTAIERVNGRLKEEYGLVPLRVRGLAAVSLHVDLALLALLAARLARASAEAGQQAS